MAQFETETLSWPDSRAMSNRFSYLLETTRQVEGLARFANVTITPHIIQTYHFLLFEIIYIKPD